MCRPYACKERDTPLVMCDHDQREQESGLWRSRVRSFRPQRSQRDSVRCCVIASPAGADYFSILCDELGWLPRWFSIPVGDVGVWTNGYDGVGLIDIKAWENSRGLAVGVVS
jgi:hypothetical protein